MPSRWKRLSIPIPLLKRTNLMCNYPSRITLTTDSLRAWQFIQLGKGTVPSDRGSSDSSVGLIPTISSEMGIVPPLWVVVLCFLYLLSTFNPVSPSRIRVPLLSRIKASSPKVKAEKHMVFFSPDIHDGTRRDLALTLYNLISPSFLPVGSALFPGTPSWARCKSVTVFLPFLSLRSCMLISVRVLPSPPGCSKRRRRRRPSEPFSSTPRPLLSMQLCAPFTLPSV